MYITVPDEASRTSTGSVTVWPWISYWLFTRMPFLPEKRTRSYTLLIRITPAAGLGRFGYPASSIICADANADSAAGP